MLDIDAYWSRHDYTFSDDVGVLSPEAQVKMDLIGVDLSGYRIRLLLGRCPMLASPRCVEIYHYRYRTVPCGCWEWVFDEWRPV